MRRLINWLKQKFKRKQEDPFDILFGLGGGIVKSHKKGKRRVIDEIELYEFSLTDLGEESNESRETQTD